MKQSNDKIKTLQDENNELSHQNKQLDQRMKSNSIMNMKKSKGLEVCIILINYFNYFY
jgi:hypothetical protein